MPQYLVLDRPIHQVFMEGEMQSRRRWRKRKNKQKRRWLDQARGGNIAKHNTALVRSRGRIAISPTGPSQQPPISRR